MGWGEKIEDHFVFACFSFFCWIRIFMASLCMSFIDVSMGLALNGSFFYY